MGLWRMGFDFLRGFEEWFWRGLEAGRDPMPDDSSRYSYLT